MSSCVHSTEVVGRIGHLNIVTLDNGHDQTGNRNIKNKENQRATENKGSHRKSKEKDWIKDWDKLNGD